MPGTTEPVATPTPPTGTSGAPLAPTEPEQPKGSYTARTIEDKPAEGASLGHFDDRQPEGGHGGGSKSGNPVIAVELSLQSAYTANPYIQYKGYTFETGTAAGVRLEGNLKGLMVAYEVSNMANEQACGTQCIMGEFGSTRVHSLEVGYRYRLGELGPIRPFLAGSLGGVLASQGTWTTDSRIAKGGIGRLAAGIEVPILGKFFASASIAYRVVVTENPFRSVELEAAQMIFVDAGDPPNGDYAEDLHLVSGYVGFGVSL